MTENINSFNEMINSTRIENRKNEPSKEVKNASPNYTRINLQKNRDLDLDYFNSYSYLNKFFLKNDLKDPLKIKILKNSKNIQEKFPNIFKDIADKNLLNDSTNKTKLNNYLLYIKSNEKNPNNVFSEKSSDKSSNLPSLNNCNPNYNKKTTQNIQFKNNYYCNGGNCSVKKDSNNISMVSVKKSKLLRKFISKEYDFSSNQYTNDSNARLQTEPNNKSNVIKDKENIFKITKNYIDQNMVENIVYNLTNTNKQLKKTNNEDKYINSYQSKGTFHKDYIKSDKKYLFKDKKNNELGGKNEKLKDSFIINNLNLEKPSISLIKNKINNEAKNKKYDKKRLYMLSNRNLSYEKNNSTNPSDKDRLRKIKKYGNLLFTLDLNEKEKKKCQNSLNKNALFDIMLLKDDELIKENMLMNRRRRQKLLEIQKKIKEMLNYV